MDADERLLDDVLAGRGVVEQQRGEAEQRTVVGAVRLGEVVDGGARRRDLLGTVTLTGKGRGLRGGHRRDHRHATGRAGRLSGPAGRPQGRAARRHGEVEYLCHASWTPSPR
ncbi:hypothetical protein GCM10018772_10440 [Streptomyces fumanus]|uniref:Uncharacterized protein n=1 Tax=Streptomyces fumanus TaxID=67302 RepID=A0A919A603_9ACTN|nr:hypothetical protein GCM10018772_10440 [Streptomyces fumanus]